MKAIIYNEYGSADNLKFAEVPKPEQNENEILVKVYAASVNSWDWDLVIGGYFLVKLDGGFPKPKRQILGCDIAGVVEAVGKNIKAFKPGDEVYGDLSGYNWGGFAEYVCADEKSLFPKPKNISFEEAAAVPQAAVLALQGLRYFKEIKPGEKLLINGAGGGVGTYGLQMAKLMGAEVTCVDKSEKLEMLTSLGADFVIDYTKEDFTKNGKTYDRIIDVTAKRSFFEYKRSLNPDGVFAMIGGETSKILQTALLGSFFPNGGKKLGLIIHKTNKDLDYISELLESGKIKSVIHKTFPLNETADAVKLIGEGKVKGKVIIKTRN